MLTAPIDCLMQAHAARCHIRGELVKRVRALPKPWCSEIEALLKADDAAGEGLAIALTACENLPDLGAEFAPLPPASPPAGELHVRLADVGPIL